MRRFSTVALAAITLGGFAVYVPSAQADCTVSGGATTCVSTSNGMTCTELSSPTGLPTTCPGGSGGDGSTGTSQPTPQPPALAYSAPSKKPAKHKHKPRVFYKNPFREVMKNGSLRPRRIDEGVDYSGHGRVFAMGDGIVTFAGRGVWFGNYGLSVVYRLLDGPAAGKSVYVSESCTPVVSVHRVVHKNTVVCMMHGDNYPWVETGWAAGDVPIDPWRTPITERTPPRPASTSRGSCSCLEHQAAGSKVRSLTVICRLAGHSGGNRPAWA